MLCSSCGQRKARRACPALGQDICAICCGTKRLVEIRCPSTCRYLASSREHPAAVVLRQRALDVAALMPTIQRLTERQYQLFFLLHTVISRYKPEGFSPLTDADVAEAAASFAATLETAGRGVIYEHVPPSPNARQLAGELKHLIADMRQEGATVYDGETAIVLRAIEEGARETGKASGDDIAYLSLLGRLLRQQSPGDSASRKAAAESSPIILP